MEPFGLFRFLQSFLSQTAAETPPPPPEPAPQAPSPEQEQQSESPSQAPRTQNAALDFLAAHEARAKRTKKP